MRSSKTWHRTVLAFVASVGCLCSLAGQAWGRQLKVTKFSFQTTTARQVPGPLTHENWGFENVPAQFTQAGGHPDAVTATFEFENETLGEQGPSPTRDPKDVAVMLPTGFLGNPIATPRCPLSVVLAQQRCAPATQVGVAVVDLLDGQARVSPIVNVIPEAGQTAEFAIETFDGINFVITAHVARTASGYGVLVTTRGIPNNGVIGAETTFWGVPASPSHDAERGLTCVRAFEFGRAVPWHCSVPGGETSEAPEVPFLTLPSDCTAGGLPARMSADSWEEPGNYVEAQPEVKEGERILPTVLNGAERRLTGCSLLQFGAGLDVEPDSLLADAPVGLDVNVAVPQIEVAQRPASPPLRDATVSLPPGMSVNPSAVDGIQACDKSGPEGIDFTGPESEEVGISGESQLAPGHCPDASIVGTAKAFTPLLNEPVEGHVYLARPGCGGSGLPACTQHDVLDGNLYKLYLELGGKGPLSRDGVNVKLEGRAQVDPSTGQITTRFADNPQFPFSRLQVHLEGGANAPLANPPACGPAVSRADFSPWGAPGFTQGGLFVTGVPDATPASFYEVGGCSTPRRLSPGFAAGMVTTNAAKFGTFTLSLSRKDREQYVKGLQIHTPPGLLGVLASVPLCGEADANAGTCPEASKVGTTRVATGAGERPFEVEGAIYLTGGYRGAPFGLSIVTNAVAGPFDLGRVVVRARIDVDPNDSTLTITTDESGPYAIPQILFGIPLRLQRIVATVGRPDFMFNPTDCAQERVTAAVSGSDGTVASVSNPFAAGGCAGLKFKPVFRAFTSARTSRARGASLDTQLSYPKGAFGNDANIARVKVSLPKQLPSYLPTLQKACLAATFETDPAACPPASVVGIVRARTPLLPVGLSGPVYIVSHGGEEFPSLIIVLQGDRVRVDLVGSTFIKKGVTSSTFKAVPDVPVDTFELYLPQGKNHALAANGNLCKQAGKLVMPTEFVAQNGAVVRQRTPIAVSGCGRSKSNRSKVKRRAGS